MRNGTFETKKKSQCQFDTKEKYRSANENIREHIDKQGQTKRNQ